MKRAILAAMLALLAWTQIPFPIQAAEEAKAGHAYVVLVGIADYADKQIKPRSHAVEDVQALYDLFTNKNYLGADKDNVRLLLGGAEDQKRNAQPATKANILQALKWMNQAKADDLVIFTFIGQGGTLGEKGDRLCYFPSDSTVKDRNKNALAAAEISQELDKLKSHRFCAFLDVDFKGFTPGQGQAAEPRLDEAFFREFLGDDGSEDHLPVQGRVMVLGNGLSQSLDLKDHGLFTQVLLEGLKGKADKEGYEADGVVTVDELTTYLSKELPELARKFGKGKQEREQHYFSLAGRNSHFTLTCNPEVAAKAKERLDKFSQLSKDNSSLTPELVKEGNALLARMPKLESQRSLRKEYQRLADGKVTVEKFLADRNNILEKTKLERAESDAFANKVIDGGRMLTRNYVKKIKLGELVNWAIRGLYRRIDEKIPDEIKARLDKAKSQGEEELKVLLADVREQLGKREDLENHKDIDYALQMMTRHLDPYTTYIDADTLSRFKTETRGLFIGVGIQIRKDVATDMLQVISPILNSPAYKAGIQAGDIVTTITREVDEHGKPLDPPDVISTKGLSTTDAVKKILGVPNTKVKLTVQREGEEKPLEFEVKRNLIEVETVMGTHRKSDDAWDFYIDSDRKIAYVRLTQFGDNTYRDLIRAMATVKKQGLKGLILDLRFNPGGLLKSACEVSDLFIDDGLIVTIRHRIGKPDVWSARHEGSLLDFPMVCLINGHSASGSEIVAACLQDHKRAVIMGERSYGKGSVQDIQDFEGGQLKLTTASYWRPSGKNINRPSTSGKEEEEWGVMPEKQYLMKLSPKELDDLEESQKNSEIIRRSDKVVKEKHEFKDRQLEMALEYLRDQLKLASRLSGKKAS